GGAQLERVARLHEDVEELRTIEVVDEAPEAGVGAPDSPRVPRRDPRGALRMVEALDREPRRLLAAVHREPDAGREDRVEKGVRVAGGDPAVAGRRTGEVRVVA